MTNHNFIITPQYSIDTFYRFLIDNNLSENSFIFVPDASFKKELISYIAQNKESAIPPYIISIDSIYFEEKSLYPCLDTPFDFEIIDDNSALFILEQLCINMRGLSASNLFEHIKEIQVEKLYDTAIPIKTFHLGIGASKFIELLRKSNLYLRHHANFLAIHKLNFNSLSSDTFFFKNIGQNITSETLEKKLLRHCDLLIFKECTTKVICDKKIQIKTTFNSEYDDCYTILQSDLVNEHDLSITSDADLLYRIKTQNLDDTAFTLLNDNVDFFKLSMSLFQYYDTQRASFLLEILKVKAFETDLKEMIKLEFLLRKQDFTSLENFPLVTDIKKQRKPQTLHQLFAITTNLLENHGHDNLYLEHALNHAAKISDTFTHFKLEQSDYLPLISRLIKRVQKEIVDELSPLKNFVHIKDTRYKKIANVTLVNFHNAFFDHSTINLKPTELSTEDILLYSLHSANATAITITNFNGKHIEPYTSNLALDSKIKLQTKAPDTIHQSLKPIARSGAMAVSTLSPTSIKVLIGNPYLFYLKYILKIKENNDINCELDSKNFGIILHKCLELINFTDNLNLFIENFTKLFLTESRNILGDNTSINTLRIHLIANKIFYFLNTFHNHTAYKESKGQITFENINLSATADLILEGDNKNILVDYKTGTPPAPKDVYNGKEPQLAIEALILERGGFGIKSNPTQICILKTATSAEKVSDYEIDIPTVEQGLSNLHKLFFQQTSTYFSPNVLQNNFTEQTYYGIIRKEEWVDFNQ